MTTNNSKLAPSRRSVLKVISSSTLAATGINSVSAANSTEQHASSVKHHGSVNLVEVTLFGDLEDENNQDINKLFIDDMRPYRVSADSENLVVESKEIANTLASESTKVSVLNLAGEYLQPISDPVSIPQQKMIPVELATGIPVQGVIPKNDRGFGNAHLSESTSDSVDVNYRGSKANVKSDTTEVVRKSPVEIPVEIASESDGHGIAELVPSLQIINHGSLSIHTI